MNLDHESDEIFSGKIQKMNRCLSLNATKIHSLAGLHNWHVACAAVNSFICANSKRNEREKQNRTSSERSITIRTKLNLFRSIDGND